MTFVSVFISIIYFGTCYAKVKIAIVGGGIGGTSLAYFLRQSYSSEASLDLFESGEIGGRMATTIIAHHEYEVGASVIHEENKYMTEFREYFRLQKVETEKGGFAIFGEENKVLFESSPTFGSFSMIIRYGFRTLFKLYYLLESFKNNFRQIYELLEKGISEEYVEGLLNKMTPVSKYPISSSPISHITNISINEHLKKNGFNELFIHEIVNSVCNVNYGQLGSTIHAFVGIVSLIGSDSNLWSLHGGNKIIPRKLLEASQALLISATVNKVSRMTDSKYEVTYSTIQGGNLTQFYDIVVIATPLTSDKIQPLTLSNISVKTFEGSYHRTVATLVHGTPIPSFFGYSKSSEMPNNIFYNTHYNNKYSLNSLSKLTPVNYTSGSSIPEVWKIFSQRRLRSAEIELMFEKVKELQIFDWLAYPTYQSRQSNLRKENFILDNNLYYISGIEKGASAMEMSVIGAKNVANLIHTHSLHSLSPKKSKKSEL